MSRGGSGLKHFARHPITDMDGQMRSFAITFLVLGVLLKTLPDSAVATVPNRDPENVNRQEDKATNQDLPSNAATETKSSVFPNHLDISTLQNMPLIILHPRTPINFEMLPGDNLASIHRSLNPSKILELLQSATFSSHEKLPPPLNQNKEENREARNSNSGNRQPQATVNRPISSHSETHSNDPALPRSLMNPHANNGWFQKFRGSFSNMFPMIRPVNEGPFPLNLPTVNLPVFLPQSGAVHGTISPLPVSSLQQFQSLPWRKLNLHAPSIMHMGDLTADSSHLSPFRMLFGNPHMNRFRPAVMRPHLFGGDLATSGSTFIPRRVIPPPYPFARLTPPVQRHKPLFNNIGGLQAASMEISNAFADFTDSKEHGPEVTQKFGSVGHSINNFLKMMGLGSDLNFGGVGGFGGGADLAALDSTPIARSLDFYPGYGNQAHLDDIDNLDDIDDFPIFQEDITAEFMKKMNLTNATSVDGVKKYMEMQEKETHSPDNMKLFGKSKMPVIKGLKVKGMDDKPWMSEEMGVSFASAMPMDKMKDEKHLEYPKVSYKIPPIHSTVAPYDRKKPIAIYQHFHSEGKDAPKPPTYAPAEPLPHHEEEENPNKLVDEDEVRQWRLVNSGQGYVEKRPIPILDILQSSMQPESLKVLQKVVSNTVKKDSS